MRQTAQQNAQARGDDEKAIRQVVDAFTKAYNNGDAKTLASLFLADGEIVNEEGQCVHGQEAIERTYADVFKVHPRRAKSKCPSDRFVSSVHQSPWKTAARRSSSSPANRLGRRNRYTVVHVKQDGAWRMASASDIAVQAAPAREEVKQLHWLIGDWVDESPDSDGHYLLSLGRR